MTKKRREPEPEVSCEKKHDGRCLNAALAAFLSEVDNISFPKWLVPFRIIPDASHGPK